MDTGQHNMYRNVRGLDDERQRTGGRMTGWIEDRMIWKTGGMQHRRDARQKECRKE